MKSGWRKTKLGDIAVFRNGINYSKKNFGKGIKVINVRNFKDWSFTSYEDLDEINPSGVIRDDDLLQEGDIIFVRSNGNRALIGRSMLVREIVEPVTHSAFSIKTRFISKDADPRFFAYLFRTPLIRKVLSAHGGGTNINNLNQDILSRLEISLPSIGVQRHIASILSAYDDLIENNNHRIKILEEMAKLIYREWFVEFKAPGVKLRKATAEEKKVTGKDVFPEGWEIRRFGDVVQNYDSKRIPISSMKRAEMRGEYPYYGAAKILDYINDFIFDGKYLLVAEDGSVITPERKPVLQLVNCRFWPNNHTHVIQGKPPVSTDYLYLVLSHVDISGYITGAAQPKITQENLNRIPVLQANDKLMHEFDTIVSPNIALIGSLENATSNLRKTRDLLLPKLVSGEVEVS
jgi:type I restriction enzyme S subunit